MHGNSDIYVNRYLAHIGTLILLLIITQTATANHRFQSSYPCSDTTRYCASSGMRIVDGFEVEKDCWEYRYSKTCDYPSKNDCAQHSHCYSLGQRDCLLRDTLGNCINIKKEFSCKTWNPTHKESERIRYGTQNKEGAQNLICKGIPCIDGNCVDKSYEMDADMVKSVSHLGASSKGKRSGTNTKIFEGVCRKCIKKPVGYSNCCKLMPKGWGRHLGAECTEGERLLSQDRQNNLCVYVGKTRKRALVVTHSIKHHYCCFSNVLEKTIQVEARKQLGLSFGTGYSPNCRGLTVQEIARVDFSRMDFSEIGAEMYKKIAMPNMNDVQSRIKSSFRNTTKFDHNRPAHEKNKASGVNAKSFRGTE